MKKAYREPIAEQLLLANEDIMVVSTLKPDDSGDGFTAGYGDFEAI